ncbi:hypothetical protein AAV32_11610 [Kerstersia gyiorum]|uniref:Uncharacterized protein n=1 Tax=Kerstersia gyiorum TaxID=206506 RepID=A0A171KRF6_9BURK|nr:hypothetical protein AAV32_11610 [Kerstersia gyiorum]
MTSPTPLHIFLTHSTSIAYSLLFLFSCADYLHGVQRVRGIGIGDIQNRRFFLVRVQFRGRTLHFLGQHCLTGQGQYDGQAQLPRAHRYRRSCLKRRKLAAPLPGNGKQFRVAHCLVSRKFHLMNKNKRYK